jgi:hypothetical protein
MMIILVSCMTARLLASKSVHHYGINVQRTLVEVLGKRCSGEYLAYRTGRNNKRGIITSGASQSRLYSLPYIIWLGNQRG